MQMKKTGRDRTIVANNKSVQYSCGLSMFGDLAQWPEARRRCVELKRKERHKDLSFSAQVIQVSASENNAAFVMQSGEVGFASGSFRFFVHKNYLLTMLIFHRFSLAGGIISSVVVT